MTIKLGLMGFGNIGRKLYSESLKNNDIEISAISDIGDPEILEYLLKTEFENTKNVSKIINSLKFCQKLNKVLLDFSRCRISHDFEQLDFPINVTDVNILERRSVTANSTTTTTTTY